MTKILITLPILLMTLSATHAANFVNADDATNADGFVTYSEALTVMPNLTESDFIYADQNGDGKLTPSEFKELPNS
ncbi:MAG: hypothetical protein ABJO86_12630 [Lentilitoribacter sp.]